MQVKAKEERGRIRGLREAGLTIKAIAARLGRSTGAISKALKQRRSLPKAYAPSKVAQTTHSLPSLSSSGSALISSSSASSPPSLTPSRSIESHPVGTTMSPVSPVFASASTAPESFSPSPTSSSSISCAVPEHANAPAPQ
ncbi:hypothetical protein P43SY_010482 [Pythium insidiosum]|uniref:Transposase IS30-like HTH domain-containing protein n=1 Tax=Pythium insidiosum TaxID=114742 RepID=A0AAD5L796_PYTIN|nr:hypothetical protein P43SY_010482 [Pythium insidiosum]